MILQKHNPPLSSDLRRDTHLRITFETFISFILIMFRFLRVARFHFSQTIESHPKDEIYNTVLATE